MPKTPNEPSPHLPTPTHWQIDHWPRQAIIDGGLVAGSNPFSVVNPANGQPLAQVHDYTDAQFTQAIDSAHQAWQSWQHTPPRERHQLLLQWAEQLSQHHTGLSQLLCLENGKPLAQAEGEIQHCITMLRWYAEETRRLTGEVLPKHNSNLQHFTQRQPLGVVAAITPWNFPAAAVIVKAGAAIAAGCTCIVKPSEHTPLIALALASLAVDAGLPAGVLNAVPASEPKHFGQILCTSPKIAMVSFTGSTAVGRQLYQQCGPSLKRLALELGGNAPFLVFDDCDIERTVAALVSARFYNSGQICVGANRILVQASIAQRFTQALARAAQALTVAPGHAPGCDIGPLINQTAKTRLIALLQDAIAQGAQLHCGDLAQLSANDSLLMPPFVLSHMQTTMAAYQAELFGPVACLYTFNDEADAINLANDTQAGLAAYVYSGSYPRLLRVSEQLQAGSVGANSCELFSEDVPFGGIKSSGFGKEQGLHCLHEFTYLKSVALGL
ncbi:NAD-dependent succinate-semialdehyde dehydrogenase [Halioxenophilus aromaticivorans]|uniref:NAD-dependent succinate-semialdehyde dehydrogenase n=1 Tax=Halioxenophilus aromaticivorans TaxID=1306992 RepID=A0AAV3U2M3_9ALTE